VSFVNWRKILDSDQGIVYVHCAIVNGSNYEMVFNVYMYE